MTTGVDTMRASAADRRHGEQGAVLLVVLWIVALLAVLALGFARVSRTEASLVRNRYAAARAEALADTGIALAILGLLDAGQQGDWRADGRWQTLAYGRHTVRISVQDDAGKLDVNKAPDDVLTNLFRNAGVGAQSAALVAAIDAWKDRRRALWRGYGGAPDTFPGTVGGQFLTLDELRRVPGMSDSIYDRVSPFLTVYSYDYRIDPLTASATVLRSLPGADPAQVTAYIAARRQVGAVPDLLPRLTGIDRFLALKPVTIVSIEAQSRSDEGARFTRDAIVELIGTRGQPYRLLAWQQGRRSDLDDAP